MGDVQDDFDWQFEEENVIREEPDGATPYDLDERTARFGGIDN